MQKVQLSNFSWKPWNFVYGFSRRLLQISFTKLKRYCNLENVEYLSSIRVATTPIFHGKSWKKKIIVYVLETMMDHEGNSSCQYHHLRVDYVVIAWTCISKYRRRQTDQAVLPCQHFQIHKFLTKNHETFIT